MWGVAESARSLTPRQGTVFEDLLNHARRHPRASAFIPFGRRCAFGQSQALRGRHDWQAERQTGFIHFLVAAHLGLRTEWDELDALLIV